MRVPAVPKVIAVAVVATYILEHVGVAVDFTFGDVLYHLGNRERVVNRSEWACLHFEFTRRELCRNVVCKTGTDEYQVRLVVDAQIAGGNVYFREKVHTANLNRI